MKGRVAGAPVTKADGGHRAAVPRRDPARRLARAIGNRAFAGLAQRSVARVQSGEVDALLQYGLAEEGYTDEDVQRDIDEEWQRVEQARAGRETVGFIDQEIGFDLATLGFEEIEAYLGFVKTGEMQVSKDQFERLKKRRNQLSNQAKKAAKQQSAPPPSFLQSLPQGGVNVTAGPTGPVPTIAQLQALVNDNQIRAFADKLNALLIHGLVDVTRGPAFWLPGHGMPTIEVQLQVVDTANNNAPVANADFVAHYHPGVGQANVNAQYASGRHLKKHTTTQQGVDNREDNIGYHARLAQKVPSMATARAEAGPHQP